MTGNSPEKHEIIQKIFPTHNTNGHLPPPPVPVLPQLIPNHQLNDKAVLCTLANSNCSFLAVTYMAWAIGDGICFANVAFVLRIAAVNTSEWIFVKL